MQVIIFALNGAADDITTYGSGRCVALQNSLLRVRRITNHQSLKSDTHNITPDSAARCSPVACAGGNAVRAHTKGGDTCFLTGGGHLGGGDTCFLAGGGYLGGDTWPLEGVWWVAYLRAWQLGSSRVAARASRPSMSLMTGSQIGGGTCHRHPPLKEFGARRLRSQSLCPSPSNSLEYKFSNW